MSKAFETFEQYCYENQKNVVLEEHFLEDGTHYVLCRHKEKCQIPNCKPLLRRTEQMNSLKTFKK